MGSAFRPLLASSLLEVQRNRHVVDLTSQVIGTGQLDLDTALQGGIARGRISCVSGERGLGKTLISMHMLATYLLASQEFQAAVIDTTGTFDILRLHQIILARLGAQTKQPDLERDRVAANALDRVKIMRVFDFIGISESINELRDNIRTAQTPSPKKATARYIPDSQAEDDDEETMLFDGGNNEPDQEKRLQSVGLVIIDSITHAVNPMLKTDWVQGQSLLSTFLRSLKHFIQENHIAALLINNATAHTPHLISIHPAISLPGSSRLPPQSTYIPDPSSPAREFMTQPSIFASTTVRPSLGRPFAVDLDMHMLLSQVPKRRGDAEILVGAKSGRAETVCVLEILSHRHGDRVGQWGAFTMAKRGIELGYPK